MTNTAAELFSNESIRMMWGFARYRYRECSDTLMLLLPAFLSLKCQLSATNGIVELNSIFVSICRQGELRQFVFKGVYIKQNKRRYRGGNVMASGNMQMSVL